MTQQFANEFQRCFNHFSDLQIPFTCPSAPTPWTHVLLLVSVFIHPQSVLKQLLPSSLPLHAPACIVACHHPAMSTWTAKPLWFISFIIYFSHRSCSILCNFLHQKPPGFDCVDINQGRPCDIRNTVLYVLFSDYFLTGTTAWKVMPIL